MEMATEKRLIWGDIAESQLKKLADHYHGSFSGDAFERAMQLIAELPSVDAVEVVLCKDCKHRGDDVHCPMCFEETIEIDEGDGYWDTDYITHDRTIDDGYCDRGERKDNA